NRPHPWMFECADGAWIQPFVTFVDSAPFLEAMVALGHVPPEIEGEPTEAHLAVYREVFASRTSDEWVADMRTADVDCEVMLHVGDIFRLDVAREAGAMVEVDDRVFGLVRQAAAPFDTDPSPRVTGPAPALDEHGEGIRRDGWGTRPHGKAVARLRDVEVP